MLSFTTGVSAIRASQAGLDTVANNLTNANTPGYHRQITRLSTRLPIERAGLLTGTGVVADQIDRLRGEIVAQSINNGISDLASTRAQLDTLRQVELLFNQGPGSVHDRVQQFFGNLQALSTHPDDSTLRLAVLESGRALAAEINSISRGLTNITSELDLEIQQAVADINEQSREISTLNKEISVADARGLDANDLRDRRDQLLDNMAELIEVELVPQPNSPPVVALGQGAGLIGHEPATLEVATDMAGKLIVKKTAFDGPATIASGRLAGLLESRNEIMGDFSSRLSEFVTALVQTIDGLHATGIGTAGSFTLLSGERAVAEVDLPLAQSANLPVAAGELFVAATDAASDTRTLHRVAIDPATMSLQDVAAAISAIDHVQAVVDAQTNTLQVIAEPAFAFDFTGRLATEPNTTNITGTTTVQVGGVYSGQQNEQFTFEAIGSGDIGTTQGLTIEVRDAGGALVNVLDVGLGYEPGSALEIVDGISISLSPGSISAGSTFSVNAVADADTAGILTALGLNTFFAGTATENLRIASDLADPSRFAASVTGAPGDSRNLHAMIAARDAAAFAGATDTLESHLAATTALAGQQAKDFELLAENLTIMQQSLEAERDRVSGVDPNEELIKMLDFQRSFQVAARFITTVDETLQELISIIG